MWVYRGERWGSPVDLNVSSKRRKPTRAVHVVVFLLRGTAKHTTPKFEFEPHQQEKLFTYRHTELFFKTYEKPNIVSTNLRDIHLTREFEIEK